MRMWPGSTCLSQVSWKPRRNGTQIARTTAYGASGAANPGCSRLSAGSRDWFQIETEQNPMTRTLIPHSAKTTVCLLGALAATMAAPASRAQTLKLSKEEMVALTAQSPFERFPDGRPKVPDALLAGAKGMSMEEAFAILPNRNFHNQYADGLPVVPRAKERVGGASHPQFGRGRPQLDAARNAKAQAAGTPRLFNQAAL